MLCLLPSFPFFPSKLENKHRVSLLLTQPPNTRLCVNYVCLGGSAFGPRPFSPPLKKNPLSSALPFNLPTSFSPSFHHSVKISSLLRESHKQLRFRQQSSAGGSSLEPHPRERSQPQGTAACSRERSRGILPHLPENRQHRLPRRSSDRVGAQLSRLSLETRGVEQPAGICSALRRCASTPPSASPQAPNKSSAGPRGCCLSWQGSTFLMILRARELVICDLMSLQG